MLLITSRVDDEEQAGPAADGHQVGRVRAERQRRRALLEAAVDAARLASDAVGRQLGQEDGAVLAGRRHQAGVGRRPGHAADLLVLPFRRSISFISNLFSFF